jgi:hypothetical protein
MSKSQRPRLSEESAKAKQAPRPALVARKGGQPLFVAVASGPKPKTP